nr:large subunit ribosomal protein L22 [uncultured archaeon]
MKQRYALEKNENMACATGLSLPISTKHSVEICSFIRNKKLETAIAQLKEVAAGKRAVPYKRYNRDLAHKRGMAAGRYPQKACKEIIRLLESVKANAEDKNLGESLVIKHISASGASAPWHYGRQRRRKTKRTHIKVVVEELEEKREEKREKRKAEGKGAEGRKEKIKGAAGDAADDKKMNVKNTDNKKNKNNKKDDKND